MAIFKKGDSAEEPQKKQRPNQPESKISLIAQGVYIEGNIVTHGDIRVEGKIKGTLHCKAKLVLGASGSLEGNVDAQNAMIAGKIEGQIVVRDMVQIQESGKINGDLTAGNMAMQKGGVVTGTLKMGKEAQEFIKTQPPIGKIDQLKESKGTETNNNHQATTAQNREAASTTKTTSAETKA